MILLNPTIMPTERASRLAAIARVDAKSIYEVQTLIPKAVVDGENRTVTGIVGAAAVDVDNEVVDPSGGDFSYFPKQVNSVYWQHDYKSLPVGKCRRLRATKDGKLECVTTIAKSGFGDDLLEAISQGIVQGLSLGFIPEEYGPPTPEESRRWPGAKNIIRKWKALEYSITPMPCNPQALITAVAKARIRYESALKFGYNPSAAPTAPTRKTVVVLNSGLVVTRETA